jgi:DNA polymerase-3 subunit delta
MIILIYGQDTYRSNQKLVSLIAQKQREKNNSIDVSVLDFGDRKIEYHEIKDWWSSNSLFKQDKILVIKNIFDSGNAQIKEDFKEELEHYQKSADTLIFYETESIPARDSLFVELKKTGQHFIFEPLQPFAVVEWINIRAGDLGVKINLDAANELSNFVGNDLWRIQSELEKLACYCREEPISVKAVRALIRPNISSDIFKTIDAIAQRKRAVALSLIYRHLKHGEDAFYLLSMINYQFRNLIILKDLLDKNANKYQIPQLSGLHPYVVTKTLPILVRFDMGELKDFYQRIFQTDINIKTGLVDADLALDMIVFDV